MTGKFIVDILYYAEKPTNPIRLESRGIPHTRLQDYILDKYAEFMDNEKLDAELRFE